MSRLSELNDAGAITHEQRGQMHVVTVKLPECETPQQFVSIRGFYDAMLLADRGVNWEPVRMSA